MPGRPPEVSDLEILREVALAPGPVVTSPELADAVDMGNSGMNKRLDKLVDRGMLNEREVGANAIVYWLTEDGRDFVSSQGASDTAQEDSKL